MYLYRRFEGKAVLVTGAGSGIGYATSLRFAAEGANLVINDMVVESAKKTAEQIERLGAKPVVAVADVTDQEQVEGMVVKALQSFGKIDILVCNVGLFLPRLFKDMTLQDWDDMLAINLRSVFLCCKSVVDHMIERRYGKIVNISSVGGKRGAAYNTHYIAAKHAVLGLTRSLALELAPYNITVNAVCPGFIWTPTQERYIREWASMIGRDPEEIRKERLASIPLGRFGKPEDVAGVVCFLASSDADWMTGQAINICGGMLMV